ncbi:MAG: radical SAM protein [archaeon]|nr:MAG: radical SAM protein [archaeon]
MQKNLDMSKKVLFDAVDYLSRDKKPLLKFFGGEPLLRFDLIKEAVEYSKKKGFDIRFSIVTSGVGLKTEMVKYLKENDIKVMFSIDGDRESNIFRFPAKQNENHKRFSEIKNNLKTLINTGVDVFVNMVIFPQTLSRVQKNIRFLMGLGIKRIQLGYQIGTMWQKKDMELLKKELRKLPGQFSKERIMNYSNFCEPVILSQEVVVDTDGKVYYDAAMFTERFFPELRNAYYIGDIKNIESLESLEMKKEDIFGTFFSAISKDEEKKKMLLNNIQMGIMFNDVFSESESDKIANNENPFFKTLLYGDFETQENFKKKNNIKLDSLYLFINTSCENNCIFCKNKKCEDSDIKEIERKLRMNRKLKKSKISLIGNDVLLHEKIIEIVELCNKYGFKKIEIMTSGNRLFDRRLVGDLAATGADITFSLPIFGKDSSVHDIITQNPGSFEKVIQGLKNIKNYKNLNAIIHTNILKQNMGSMEELESFVKNDLDQAFTILPVRPKDSIVPYSKLMPRYDEMISSLKVSSLMGFPLCVTGKIQEKLMPHYDDISDAMKLYFFDQKFIKLKCCSSCKLYKSCAGTFREYVKFNGTREFKPFVKNLQGSCSVRREHRFLSC